MPTGSKLITEFVGTLCFLSVIALSEPLGVLGPLAIGAALMVMVYMGVAVTKASEVGNVGPHQESWTRSALWPRLGSPGREWTPVGAGILLG